MPENHIAVIVEGTRREPQIWKQMQPLFPHDKIDTVCLPAGKNIYHIWKKLKDDDFETDVIEIVREISPEAAKSLENLERKNFSQVYLFFDLDPQQKNLPMDQDPFETLQDMLKAFNDETENGKLYVSYPMVEAIRDIKSVRMNRNIGVEQCDAFWRCAVPVSLLDQYKQKTGNGNAMADFRKYTRPVWESLNAAFLHRCACLFRWSDCQTPPETEQTERLYQWYWNNINPEKLFRAETSLLQEFQQIFVLSAFPEFLLDYFKPSYWNAFQDISHGQCAGLNAVLTAAQDNT